MVLLDVRFLHQKSRLVNPWVGSGPDSPYRSTTETGTTVSGNPAE